MSVLGGFVPKDPISDTFYDNDVVSVPSITSEAGEGKVQNNKVCIYFVLYLFLDIFSDRLH